LTKGSVCCQCGQRSNPKCFTMVCKNLLVSLFAPTIASALSVTSGRSPLEGADPSALTLLRPSHAELASVTMVSFRQDCGLTRPVGMLGMGAQKAQVPGAGLDKSVKPFAKVLKDGYFMADCVQDFMYEYGDKFGGNKQSYELSKVANVSIVHYDNMVGKEDREEMTPSVCFGLCRSIPDMMFFGIKNGNKCYCAPYYKPMASDDSVCDMPCEGDSTTICGSKTKSSVFSMHMCSNTKTELGESKEKMEEASKQLTKVTGKVSDTGKMMQEASAALQKSFGKVGDTEASDLMQAAKVRAGELEKAAKGASKVSDELKALDEKYAKVSKGDLDEFEAATEAEALIDDMDKASTNGQAQVEDLAPLLDASSPEELPKGASKEYYPTMYFVDKTFAELPSTCGGKAVGEPLVGSMDDCAAMCDSKMGDCVGFSYFPREKSGLCFLFGKLTSVTYYSGCKKKEMLLQKQRKLAGRRAAEDTKCMAKFASYEGTTLKPDPSGKCKQCLKKASEAKRCFE